MLTLSPLQTLTPVQLASSLLSASVYEAEDAARSGAQVFSSNPGYSGTGYVDFNFGAGGDTGAYIEWTVNVAAQGTYLLEIRHANGAAADRTLEMAVNGVTVRSKQSYKPTGSWSNWAISNDKVVLNAGDNTIRVTTIGLNGGNIDYLEVTQALYEAESATASQASTSSSNPGYSGTGYRDYSGNTGAYIEWTVDVPSAGNYALEFIYANGAASNRPLEIKVNGNVVNSSLAFNPTGNWTTWLTSATTTALLEGANTIRATTTGSNGANVDYLLLRKAVAGEVYLNVGDNFQSVVNNNPAGTTYIIKSGVHRQQSVIAKNGDTFLGEYGAVLNGAKVLSASAFQTDQNGRYFISGQPGDNWAFGKIKAGGNARDAYREELFVNGYTRLKHVGSIAELGPGKWFYDYPNQRIYMYDNPASFSSVEISKERGAFGGHEVSGVTIENLIIEKYATPAQHGAISFHAQHYTQNWIVRYVEARYNHGAGISLAPGITIENSKVHSNGQIGIRGVGRVDDPNRPSYGYTAYVILRNTEIYNNKVLDYDWGWEGGGTKFLYTDAGMLVENNWVHDNIGPGIWFDAYNYNATIRSNLTENNHSMGIFYEISYGPTKSIGIS
ncbi:MAG: carbohydrate-binding protein [Phycisphaerales bacterium]|nr:carbohydrate-binding protein [Phycisphaerales bacterium]